MAMNGHKVQFVWVKGHAGNKYNELCDSMAVAAAKSQKGEYYQGLRKDNRESQDKKKPKTMKFNVVKTDWKDIDLETDMQTKKAYYIVPVASCNPSDMTGKWKILLYYNGHHMIEERNVQNVKSVNEVCLIGILEGCKKIRYKEKKVIVATGNVLGFARPEKSSNKSLIDQIGRLMEQQNNSLTIMEVQNAMKSLKEMIKKYE